MALVLFSCAEESDIRSDIKLQTRDIIITIDNKGPESYREKIKTIRFFVFNNASTNPKLDINAYHEIEGLPQDATRFGTTINVHVNDDKMIVAVVNEPEALKSRLDAIKFVSELENLTFLMTEAFDDNHVKPLERGIPMTGVIRDIRVEEADQQNTPVDISMSVERSVARVEIWLSRNESLASAEVTDRTRIDLSNTYMRGYLVAGTENDGTRFPTGENEEKNFGHIMTTTSDDLYNVSWTYMNSSPLELTLTPQFICGFYTPERTYNDPSDKDKMKVDILSVNTGEEEKSFTDNMLKKFSREGGASEAITEIKRNNIYRIYGEIVGNTIRYSNIVIPWEEANVSVVIDPQFYLKVSQDNLYLPVDGNRQTITAETNYSQQNGGRDYPNGILLRDIHYYNSNKQEITDTHDELYGWLSVDLGGREGDLTRDIVFTSHGQASLNTKGSYAIVAIKAGNLSKLIKVSR